MTLDHVITNAVAPASYGVVAILALAVIIVLDALVVSNVRERNPVVIFIPLMIAICLALGAVLAQFGVYL